MTIKERRELLADIDDVTDSDLHTLLRRIILALPVDEPAKVRCWRRKGGFPGNTDRVRWTGSRMEWVHRSGECGPTASTLGDAERWERDGTWLPCPDEPAPQPPQPKPSMGAAVRELVRAADRVVNQWKSPYPSEGRHSSDYIDKLAASATAVRDLFVEESQ